MSNVPSELIQRIGQMTHMLRDSMRELGLDKEIEKAAQAIPDAQDRLGYIAAMTEQAAERALNAVDRAQPLQDSLTQGATALETRWQAWFANPLEQDATSAQALAQATRDYLAEVPRHTQATQAELLEILMAQDFQDLTGQVIKKMMDLIRQIERQLMQVLLSGRPDVCEKALLEQLARAEEERRQHSEPQLLNGPQIKPTEGSALANQDQVDDLLAELGF
ncbi:protein phosphatase CheZ [Geopseudomonas guangdongensis]|uniref:Protein phosphatase CheZ n=1 Tax=Geopseudomonas guangdongensis TaxID=1245526 RepID=A0A1H2FT18_9GAMM|nr:protein phosphatase CheZ [Pseudomonas guangdongensis]SDU10491.1 chemotaxis phosphatase, CheZ [Pseudomonas guangdongensis]